MPTRPRKRDDLDKFVDDRLGWKRVADRLALDLAVQRRIVAELRVQAQATAEQAAVIEAARALADLNAHGADDEGNAACPICWKPYKEEK